MVKIKVLSILYLKYFDLIWNMTDLINAVLLIINMLGILLLLPIIKIGLQEYQKHNA